MPPRDSLAGHAAVVAPRLLGGRLASRVGGRRVVLRITEVEAYGGVGEDPGSHAFRRQTPRNATMFGRAGLAYVYFTYGMHWCFCIVTGPEEQASAVLVRAGQVVSGVSAARTRRPSAASDRDLARGPARLTAALGITSAQDGVDLLGRGAELGLTLPTEPVRDYAVSARTGVSGAGAATPWRFYLPGEPTVSPYRRAAR